MQNNLDIDKSLFEFVNEDKKIHDTKFETKKIGYFKDAFIRFSKNKASVVAFVIICILILYAIFAPIVASTKYTSSEFDQNRQKYNRLLPKIDLFSGSGFWDGTKSMTINQNQFNKYYALWYETNEFGNPQQPIAKIKSEYQQVGVSNQLENYYDIRFDSYSGLGFMFVNSITMDEINNILAWEEETGIKVIYPAVSFESTIQTFKEDANIWYAIDSRGNPKVSSYDSEGNPILKDVYLRDSNGDYVYWKPTGKTDYSVRVLKYAYFQYQYGYEPSFIFGTDNSGYDIFTRLAVAARFSFLLAICVSVVNLVIGAIYGAIEGFYGGKIDLVMERICDILGNVPFIVVTTLFQLHLSKSVGIVPALLLAFFITGWIGTASTTRMQFYRYKNQEYVMAAKTLGASNRRLMFKHIFPNALGTLITASVLVIPSVIFSESSLTYLGIVNLNSSDTTSVGTMLANGKAYLSTYPHVILFPALFISLLMITFNLFGNGLRDAFNPSLRGADD